MPFADELLGVPAAEALVRAIADAAPDLDLAHVRAAATATALGPLALRERSDLLKDALVADIPGTYVDLARVLRQAAAASGSPGGAPLGGWLIWPVTSAVAEKAVADGGSAAFDDALALVAELTGRLTSEFAIRTLLRHDYDRALATITETWVGSDDEHVRRLASEGTRPYLPWAVRVPTIVTRGSSTIPILDALYRDESDYVRRSVANHLNDISRHDPDLVVETAARWLAADGATPDGAAPDPTTAALVRRALRSLIKKGDAGALALLGFSHVSIETTGPTLDRAAITVGDELTIEATVTNTGAGPARLSIDYVVHHRKANGATTGKTFKWAVRDLVPGERLDLMKTHSFKLITTRRYHPGEHEVELMVNGVSQGRAAFALTL